MNLSKGIMWKFLERVLVQIVKFVVQIFLARLILPDEYGILAILLVFIAFADIIAQSGLNTALIQKKEIEEEDISTVFWFSLMVSCVLYIILFFSSPLIAAFYAKPILISTLRVISVTVFFVSINGIQIAFVSRKLDFRSVFVTSLISYSVAGIISIFFAYKGMGIWALVIYQLIGSVLNVIVMLPFARINIWIKPSMKRLKRLIPFGLKLMFSFMIATFTENMYNLILGKRYSTEIVGYYTRGQQFPLAISTSINTTISSVLLPYLSQSQEKKAYIKEFARKSTAMTTYIMLPMIGGMFAIAEMMVKVLLTDKWLPCVPFLRLECLFYATIPLMSSSGQVCVALGRSDVSLKIEAIKSILTLVAIFVVMFFANVYWVIGIRAIISLIMVFVQIYYSQKIYGYTLLNRLADIMPNLIITFLMSIIVYFLSKVMTVSLFSLILLCLVGGLVYLLFSLISKNNNYFILIALAKSKTIRSDINKQK